MDLNCDMGESFGAWTIGQDVALLRLVTSANIACGLHAGDPSVMRRTVEAALAQDVAIGAHPGYPDLQGFGRRAMALTPAEITDTVLYQIGALAAFVQAAGGKLAHVKPHGALYNRASQDPTAAAAIVRAVQACDPTLYRMGQAHSALTAAAEASALPVLHEAFIDRAYEPDGSLRSRHLPGAILEEPAAIAQALSLAQQGGVRSSNGTWLAIRPDTLCIHGDTPGAVALATAVCAAFSAANIPLRAPNKRNKPPNREE